MIALALAIGLYLTNHCAKTQLFTEQGTYHDYHYLTKDQAPWVVSGPTIRYGFNLGDNGGLWNESAQATLPPIPVIPCSVEQAKREYLSSRYYKEIQKTLGHSTLEATVRELIKNSFILGWKKGCLASQGIDTKGQ